MGNPPVSHRGQASTVRPVPGGAAALPLFLTYFAITRGEGGTTCNMQLFFPNENMSPVSHAQKKNKNNIGLK